MLNEQSQREVWAIEGESLLATLLLSDQMAKANGEDRAKAIRNTARVIEDQSTDPYFKEKMREIAKLSDDKLVACIPGIWELCMQSKHFDVVNEDNLPSVIYHKGDKARLTLKDL